MKYKSIICSLIVFLMTLSSILFITPGVITTYAAYDEVVSTEEALPSEYCMRDEYIVYAQNQDSHGYCWNFASTMAAATTLMKATGEYYDFSELWTGVSLSVCTDLHGKIGRGGTFSYHYDALKQSGLMLETDLPYQESYTVSNENAVDYYNFYEKYSNDDLASCLVSDSDTSFKSSEIDEIKSHIYNHGSVYMAFSFRTGFIEKDGVYALEPNQKNTNSSHAVSVIGWDDNYQREYYLNGSSTPTVFKGAWIILNSYTEKSGNDGISFVFYNDSNIDSIRGYRYQQDTSKDLYFYDKIESGFAYPTSLKGKYYGDFTAESGLTKQKNIFYDDVNLEYSYDISSNASIKSVDVYLDGHNVTDIFDVRINHELKRFYITKNDADYGQYKVIVTYGNDAKTDSYLNNFFVTHGLVGEEVEIDRDKNSFTFNPGRDMEFYSFVSSDKNYVIYTDKLSGEISFLPTEQSVYSEKNMSIPTISYEIKNGKSCGKTYKITSESGYVLEYNFVFEYNKDNSLQPVNVYYDLGGGINHSNNHNQELAGPTTDLVLYEPTRPGYTFEGWYLDYGNGSMKLTEANGLHYISWDDIHHMGEAPSVHALYYYNNYYNNSNTVFVYAHWEEIDYYIVDITTIGEGKSRIDDSICISSDDCVRYIFDPKTTWCLSDLTINGVSVDRDELIEIAKYGLQIKNIDQDTLITATFSEGVYLSLKIGENIKSAYIIGELDGKTRKFYDGDFIPAEYFTSWDDRFDQIFPDRDDIVLPDFFASGNSSIGDKFPELEYPGLGDTFTLIVELYEEDSVYTYLLDNVDSYTKLNDGIYQKKIRIDNSDAYKEINVGSAERRVKVSYSIDSLVQDHYLSTRSDADSGEQNLGVYSEGETVYLFVKIPEDTVVYHYRLPDAFESIGDSWYRLTLSANAKEAMLGEIQVIQEFQLYTVGWYDWDGSLIYAEKYPYGTMPVYNYDSSDSPNQPVRPGDAVYKYDFIRWDDPIESVKCDASYTAVYERQFVQYSIFVEPTENGNVTPDGSNFITNATQNTYFFKPDRWYKIKDVLIDGVSVGAVGHYTFVNVSENHTICVEFQLDVWLIFVIFAVIALIIGLAISLIIMIRKYCVILKATENAHRKDTKDEKPEIEKIEG